MDYVHNSIYQVSVKEKDGRYSYRKILVEYTEIPDMYPEFAPGPPDDHPFPEFWNTAVNVYLINTSEPVDIKEITSVDMRVFYGNIHGRRDRIDYWRAMKYLEYIEN